MTTVTNTLLLLIEFLAIAMLSLSITWVPGLQPNRRMRTMFKPRVDPTNRRGYGNLYLTCTAAVAVPYPNIIINSCVIAIYVTLVSLTSNSRPIIHIQNIIGM